MVCQHLYSDMISVKTWPSHPRSQRTPLPFGPRPHARLENLNILHGDWLISPSVSHCALVSLDLARLSHVVLASPRVTNWTSNRLQPMHLPTYPGLLWGLRLVMCHSRISQSISPRLLASRNFPKNHSLLSETRILHPLTLLFCSLSNY